MKRKAIEAVPLPERNLKPTKEDYTGFSQLLEVKGEQILILDLYETRRLSAPQKLSPSKRYVTNQKEFETYRPGKDKPWGKEGLPEGGYYAPSIYFSPGADKAILEYLPECRWKKGTLGRLEENEDEIKWENRLKREQYHENGIRRRNALVKELPEDFMTWARALFEKEHYLFYVTKSAGKAAGTCSHCGQSLEFDRTKIKPVHNTTGICPACGSSVTFKAKGKQVDVRTAKKAIVVQKIEGGAVVRYLCLSYHAMETREDLEIQETCRRIKLGEKIWTYFAYDSGRYGTGWSDSNQGQFRYGDGYLYTEGLDELLKGTPYQYCAIGQLQERLKEPVNFESYLYWYPKCRFLEYMVKMGLYHLVNEYVNWPYGTNINTKGKRPEEILGISWEQIKRLVKINGGVHALNGLKLEVLNGKALTEEEMKIIDRYKISYQDLERAARYVKPSRYLRYMRQQLGKRKTAEHFVTDWLDYVHMCEAEGWELTELILMPRSLKEEHDKRAEAIQIKNDENKKRRYQEMRRRYLRDYTLRSRKYEIVVPETLDEIAKEGAEQHHCVATYVDRVAEGKTCILFLRKTSCPEQSFFTMEVKDDSLIQCRGKYNADPSGDVKRFVERFKKHLEKVKEKKQPVQAARSA